MREPVNFRNLLNEDEFNDFNSVILVGVTFEEDDDPIQQVNEFFHEVKLIPSNVNVADVRFIEGNVKGEDGRQDWLVYFKNEEGNFMFDPMVRLRIAEMVKWISDFIVNYRRDYK